MTDRTCLVDGCPKPARTRGWCSAHYERWRRNGDPGLAGDARLRPAQLCLIDGCEGKAKGRGWCGKHYWRWSTYGDPTFVTRDYGSDRRMRNDGYYEVWRPGHSLAGVTGYVLEHRLVAWDEGLLTSPDPTLHVHHKNDIKSDNRPDNLEVLTESAHHRYHIAEVGHVVNQYGTWPLRRVSA